MAPLASLLNSIEGLFAFSQGALTNQMSRPHVLSKFRIQSLQSGHRISMKIAILILLLMVKNGVFEWRTWRKDRRKLSYTLSLI